jgi:hypothetical protein
VWGGKNLDEDLMNWVVLWMLAARDLTRRNFEKALYTSHIILDFSDGL